MFTGLVQTIGTVAGIEMSETGRMLRIDAGSWDHQPSRGSSINVSGCCLTVAELDDDLGHLRFDVVSQTLSTTMLGELQAGDRVNLEHAATPTTLLGGHIVQGHVDGVGVVRAIDSNANDCRVRLTPPRELLDFLVSKGSIAIDGVSLTIASVNETGFEVALIPTTLRKTTLSDRKAGDRVNLEVDCLAKTVVHWLQRHQAT